MSSENNLFEAWLSGRTVRKHTMHVHRRENTAEHTWGILLLLAKYLPDARAAVMRFIVLHDAGEQGAFDMPAHIYTDHPEVRALVQAKEDAHVHSVLSGPHIPGEDYEVEFLTETEMLVVEILDRAEFVISCYYEYAMGNTLVLRPMNTGYDYLQSALEKLPPGSTRQHMTHLSSDLLRLLGPRQEK